MSLFLTTYMSRLSRSGARMLGWWSAVPGSRVLSQRCGMVQAAHWPAAGAAME